MKREDIDKRIGMPDVDEEWAKFESEVIGQKPASRKPLYWSIGIAASIALLAGIFLFGRDEAKEPQQLLAEKNATGELTQQADTVVGDSAAKALPPTPLAKRPSTDLIAMEASRPPTPTPQHIDSEEVFDCGEAMPSFPGGDRALMEFIKTNMKYPDLAVEYGARGRVVVTFKIDSLGYVSNFKVVKCGLAYDTLRMNREPEERQVVLKEQIETLMCEESIRILSLMPRWEPANQFGRFVSVRYVMPVTFRLPETSDTMLPIRSSEMAALKETEVKPKEKPAVVKC